MTEIEMLKQENKLLREQIELYKKLLEKEEQKEKEKEYIPYPYYPNPWWQYPSVTWSDHTDSDDYWTIKC